MPARTVILPATRKLVDKRKNRSLDRSGPCVPPPLIFFLSDNPPVHSLHHLRPRRELPCSWSNICFPFLFLLSWYSGYLCLSHVSSLFIVHFCLFCNTEVKKQYSFLANNYFFPRFRVWSSSVHAKPAVTRLRFQRYSFASSCFWTAPRTPYSPRFVRGPWSWFWAEKSQIGWFKDDRQGRFKIYAMKFFFSLPGCSFRFQ